MVILESEFIRETAVRALTRVAPADVAAIQVDLLLDAELRGIPSHGLLRLPRIIARIRSGATIPASKGVHDWRREAFLSVDGCRGLGPVVAESAIEALVCRVTRIGIAMAAIANANHVGMLGYYVEKAALRGYTMIALTTSEALVHPWGGRRAMLGTNPIAIGVPTGDGPFMMDTATSLVSMGEIHDHANRGVAIPGHWALDADGNPATDARAAMGGSIAPFGQAKGYALGLAFELLVSSLSGAALGTAVRGTLDDVNVCNKGDVFILIDGPCPDLAEYLQAIRDVPPADGFERVLIPGERGRACKGERLRTGVPLADETWNRIQKMADA